VEIRGACKITRRGKMIPDKPNPSSPIENLAFGKIIEVDGTHVIAELDAEVSELSRIYGGEVYPVGQFGSILKIHFGRRIIYGYVGRLRMKAEYESEAGLPRSANNADARVVEADLFGEGEWVLGTEGGKPEWVLRFERGVSTFPLPQQVVYLTPREELRFIYGHGTDTSIMLGEHVSSGNAPCYADLNELLGKHTAILGSTGAGKSGTVAAIVHLILDHGTVRKYARWKPQIVILDPHNEYSSAFENHVRLSTDEGNLRLPYWLLNFQETIALFIGKTEFVATSQANIIKNALLGARIAGAAEIAFAGRVTVDSPVPYKLETFMQEVDRQRPSGQNKKEQEPFDSVKNKLESLLRDARMNFLMSPWQGGNDEFGAVVSQLIGETEKVRIVDLSGVPNEVAGIASAVIARTLFTVKVWQSPIERESSPVLLICEEAHRYVPNSGEAQYEAAQEAIRRIAKEGRKYGIGLILVSQRPSEVEATVLSQCNSWIVLRLTNEIDRNHVRSILPDSLAGLTKVLSGLRRREAIFVGQAAMLPSRILVSNLEEGKLPRSHDISFNQGWQCEPLTPQRLSEVSERWRNQERHSGNTTNPTPA
jgi:DNA helicase HerA-like ATPase